MLFAVVMLFVQLPRIDRVVYEYDGSAAAFGPSGPVHATHRTPADLAAQAKSQRRALAVLDRLEQSVTSRATIQQAVTGVSVPGFPQVSADFTAEGLLDLPEREIQSSRSARSY